MIQTDLQIVKAKDSKETHVDYDSGNVSAKGGHDFDNDYVKSEPIDVLEQFKANVETIKHLQKKLAFMTREIRENIRS